MLGTRIDYEIQYEAINVFHLSNQDLNKHKYDYGQN